MDRVSYYIDYGSGFVRIYPRDNDLKLLWVRGEVNVFVARKKLTGSFKLSSTEAQTAKTFFIDNGNYEAPIRLYEHGTSTTGTLIFEGWATINLEYDTPRSLIEFNNFRTNDIYENFIPWIKRETQASLIPSFADFYRVLLQDQGSNLNSIQGYLWNGTNYVITGNAYPLGSIGNVCGTMMGSSRNAYFDDFTNAISIFNYVAPDYALSPSFVPNPIVLTEIMGNTAMAGLNSTTLYMAGDEDGRFRKYQLSGTVLNLINETIIFAGNMKHPAIAVIDAAGNLAYVDDISRQVQYLSSSLVFSTLSPLSIDGEKFSMCSLDTASSTIAVIDEKSKTLRALTTGGGGAFTELGSIKLNVNQRPQISQTGTYGIALYDPQSGRLERYVFTPGANTWAISGNSVTVAGGYSAAIPEGTGNIIGLVRSNSMVIRSRWGRSFLNLFEGIVLANENKSMPDAIDYQLDSTGNGSSFDVNAVGLISMNEANDNRADSEYDTNLKYSWNDLFELAELYQNYWYLELTGDPRPIKIKFTQPNLFSSFGPDIDVSAYAFSLNQRKYEKEFNINYEKFEFQNERTSDFTNEPIDYGRNTLQELVNAYNFTTDLAYLQDFIVGIASNLSKSGQILLEIDPAQAQSAELCPSGTTTLGSINVKNYLASKTQLLENYLKDYRLISEGTFLLNENNVPVQDTVRPIITFPDIEIKLDSFPTGIASLNWGSYKSYITMLEFDLATYKFNIKSVLLDLP